MVGGVGGGDRWGADGAEVEVAVLACLGGADGAAGVFAVWGGAWGTVVGAGVLGCGAVDVG